MKVLRKERGYSQVKMQMLTGIDQSDYSKIESGKRNMTFEQCRRIALALETSMDYLAGLTDEQQPYPKSKDRCRCSGPVLFACITRGLLAGSSGSGPTGPESG